LLIFFFFFFFQNCDPQTYGLGVKEIWEIDPSKHELGLVQHTIGWPSSTDTWSGSFMYHAENNRVYIGMVIGLDYSNPYTSPYQELQTWKQHPHIKKTLEGGKIVSYGARCINEGGWQSVPKVTMPGGVLIGCSAGFVNVNFYKNNI
jgi:electron-transferring-flavoprotein dehydrogenase